MKLDHCEPCVGLILPHYGYYPGRYSRNEKRKQFFMPALYHSTFISENETPVTKSCLPLSSLNVAI